MKHSALIGTLVLTLANVTYAEADAFKEITSLALSASFAREKLEALSDGSHQKHDLPKPSLMGQRHNLQKLISEKMAKQLEEQFNKDLENAVQ
ncbi:hypothetical protein HBA55_28080 [Pseudomaricurvus alkylphenolicus]|uniref:hypothetical protein n=1 Tax=Pseudomaricurvus alkylphenolicus TaxID=1306991 RepID=UPI0014244AEC|nr:hypothetical protein [Pseudomaricurvus alkylphenolicus]NIB43500.1 hypothetical protein [Pseudomaricurvus alkylphenolicus]